MNAPTAAAAADNRAVPAAGEPDSAIEPDHPLRLRLKPPGASHGCVDGAWWPRSRDLAAEVPALLDALAARLGQVETVTYNLSSWRPADRRITLAGTRVRLAGYRWQHPHTVDLIGPAHRLTLLVVPPDTARDAAERALEASLDDHGRTPDALLG